MDRNVIEEYLWIKRASRIVFCGPGFFLKETRQKKEMRMYLYWRVQQDLYCLGETITFHDPRFIRCFQKWVRRNIAGLRLAEDFDPDQTSQPTMN